MNYFQRILFVVLSIAVSACSSMRPVSDSQSTESGLESANTSSEKASPQITAEAAKPTETKTDEKAVAPIVATLPPAEIQPASAVAAAPAAEVKTEAPDAAEPQIHLRKAGEVSPEKSLQWLKNGNNRFFKLKLRSDGLKLSDRKRLSTGQKPHAIVLSCSDSRIPPEIVFDQKLGEIFVVRVAGEAPDAAAIGSIEYAVEHLGANHIVVMGHESCGAVKAALQTLDGQSAGSASLNSLVGLLHPNLQKYKNKTDHSENFIEESWSNVDGVSLSLIEKSEIIKSAVESGSLVISKAMYHLDSGKVDWK